MDARSLTIVLPAYNEEARGSRMHARPGLAVRVAGGLLRTPLIHRRVAKRRPDA